MKVNKFYFIPTLLVLVTLPLYFLHRLIVDSISDSFVFYYSIWSVYTFHFVVTLVILSVLYLVSKIVPNYIGFAFLGFILLKMIAAIVFLIPLIKMEQVSKIPDFVSFFSPYFLYLFLEIVLTLRLLRQSAP
ncbi:hypothetical protein [Aequorivita marisscotiae]|uniref:Uncharacterized protein n=1 Tax=Aequorivita marisscotiae TaxID=3040348 RepID=A0ABY8L0T9_9FLAO|nr:hypothetical protein [Aequorivita sp. Ant34-E75]WGF93582.1 hypothetical protein QCQ61_05160 [Aequorivita sp. Ant34-E75]